MGLVVAFVAGYVIGAGSGSKDLDRIVRSLQDLRRTDEFADLVTAVRSHAGHVLRDLATRLDGAAAGSAPETEDLVGQVKQLFEER